MRQWLAGLGPLFEMIENLPDDDRVFDTGDNFDRAATLLAGFDIDLEYATLSGIDKLTCHIEKNSIKRELDSHCIFPRRKGPQS
jgi:hypothetical protein